MTTSNPVSLPSAPEAEVSLLGTMLVYPNAARVAMEEGCQEEDFFVESNRKIFQAMSALYQTGSPIDLTTVSTYLKDTNALASVGDMSYLTKLTTAAVTSANTINYVHLIHDKAIMRKMIEVAQNISTTGMQGTPDVNQFLDEAEKNVLSVSRDRRVSEFRPTSNVISTVMDQIRTMSENHSDITGIKSGYRDVDHTTHGFQRGDLLILAARPAMGKTAVALNFALGVAGNQPKEAVAIFSLEMPAEQLAMRFLSARSGIEGDKIKTGNLSDEEWNRLNDASSQLRGSNIYIDDTAVVRVPEIFSKCRRLQAEHGLSLVVIDYIQLITGSNRGSDFSRQQEVSDISRNLKALARELKVPVIALSQLSRSVEARENKRPMLSDLRESGAIEQDADIVMMLYRDSYYNEEAKAEADKSGTEFIEINFAKHRNGATRKINVAFEASTNRVSTVDHSGFDTVE